ncbi:Tyrosinase-like protein orsC, partial [Lachnellula suecica]
MKTSLCSLGCLALCIPLTIAYNFSVGKAEYDAYRAQAYANQIAVLQQRDSGCTAENVIVRKEWTALTLSERKNYTDAVNCLRALPPISPPDIVPGARNRYDDFHAAHINATEWIHNSVIPPLKAYFFPWHRYFLSAYENALRDECGYTGGHPYWDWSAGDATPGGNELFSGDEGSIGSNGVAIVHNASSLTIPTSPPRTGLIPPGTGGGLGPSGPPLVDTAFNYKPRCVTRDFRPGSANQSMTYANVTNILEQPDYISFDNWAEGVSGNPHSAGHVAIGGLNDDLFAGTGDPAFYLHHGQVDHIWAVWQALDLDERLFVVHGTLTMLNSPPSANGTLDTTMDLGYNGGSYHIRDLVSTIDGPFCFIY